MDRVFSSLVKPRRLSVDELGFLFSSARTSAIVWVRLQSTGLAAVQRWVKKMRLQEPCNPTPEEVQRLASLMNAAARYLPLPATCLTRSIALVILLKKRGIKSQLRIGVRKAGASLDAHAWVEYAGIPVNDTSDVAQRYAMFSEPVPLNAFPSR
jgi:hypothetical protein